MTMITVYLDDRFACKLTTTLGGSYVLRVPLLDACTGREPTPLSRASQHLKWSRDRLLDSYFVRKYDVAVEHRAEKVHVRALVDILLPSCHMIFSAVLLTHMPPHCLFLASIFVAEQTID